jgi:hypothetical protein
VLKSYAAQATLLKPSFSRSKPAEKRKLRHSSGKYYQFITIINACKSTLTALLIHFLNKFFCSINKSHFSLTLPLTIVALEHPDADNSNKSSHPDAVANHANPVSSSSAILDMQVIQVWT